MSQQCDVDGVCRPVQRLPADGVDARPRRRSLRRPFERRHGRLRTPRLRLGGPFHVDRPHVVRAARVARPGLGRRRRRRRGGPGRVPADPSSVRRRHGQLVAGRGVLVLRHRGRRRRRRPALPRSVSTPTRRASLLCRLII